MRFNSKLSILGSRGFLYFFLFFFIAFLFIFQRSIILVWIDFLVVFIIMLCSIFINLSHIEHKDKQLLIFKDIVRDLKNVNFFVIDRDMNYLLISDLDLKFMKENFHATPKVGGNMSEILKPEYFEKTMENCNNAIKSGIFSNVDHFFLNGEDLHFLNYYSPLYDKNQKPYAVLVVTLDITENVNSETEKNKLIVTDPLTGVYNRRKLSEYFKKISKYIGKKYWLILIDIDDFKLVNDTFGHDIGDKLLARLSNLFNEIFPEKAIVTRLGGDEFCVIFESIESYILEDNIVGIESRINSKFRPYSISMGFTFIETPTDNRFDYYYRIADQNMYANKKSKKA
ncbi:sensor domain-containing diguanylate cyclase [Lactovum miscens]|nr:sensor domain-containing diguanylate cyclase [Lactovum miscens]